MSHQNTVMGFILCLFSMAVQAEHIPSGSDVLANCHGFFAKGKIKQPYKEKYTVHFYKDSRPVHCTPFAWDVMFLVPYETVNKFTGKVKPKSSFFSSTIEFEPGDKLEIYYKASERGQFLDHKYTVTVEIMEISTNGAALLKIIGVQVKSTFSP